MEISLERRWWQRFGPLDLMIVAAFLACGIYLYDPTIEQPGTFVGEVRDVILTEQPKTGFKQLAVVKLTNGDLVQATISVGINRQISVGDVVSLRRYKTLRRDRIQFTVVPGTQKLRTN